MPYRKTTERRESSVRLRNALLVRRLPKSMRARRIRSVPVVACGAATLLIGGSLLTPTAGEVYRMLAEAGPGHGRGLSQHGALHNAREGRNVEQILSHYYPGTEIGTIGPATVSVRIQGADGAEPVVYADAGARVAGHDLGPGQAARLIPQPGGGAQVVATDGCTGPVLWEEAVQDPWVHPIAAGTGRPANEHLKLCDGGAYRGSLGVATEDGEPRTVNLVDVQDYLLGVIPAEMPPGWDPVALEAQTVAARSYALAETRWPYAQTCDTTDCQVYTGTAQEDPRTTAAVVATAGRVLLRDGRILRAEYSAAPDGGSPADTQSFAVGPTPAELAEVAPAMPPAPVDPDQAASRPEGAAPQVPESGPGRPVPRTPEGSLPMSPDGSAPGVAPGETPSPIDTAYAKMGGAQGSLGTPVTPELGLPEDAGDYRMFDNGVIVYTRDLGAQVVEFSTLLQLVPELADPASGSGESPTTVPDSTESESDSSGPGALPGRVPAGHTGTGAEEPQLGGDRPVAVPGTPKIPTKMESTELYPGS